MVYSSPVVHSSKLNSKNYPRDFQNMTPIKKNLPSTITKRIREKSTVRNSQLSLSCVLVFEITIPMQIRYFNLIYDLRNYFR